MTRLRVIAVAIPACIAVGAFSAGVADVSGQVPPPPPPDLDRDGYPLPADCNDTNPVIRPGAPDLPGDGIDENCTGQDAFPFLTPQVVAYFTFERNETRVHKIVVSDVRPGATVFVGCVGRGCPHQGVRYRSRSKRQTRDVVIRKPYGDRPLRAPTARLRIVNVPPGQTRPVRRHRVQSTARSFPSQKRRLHQPVQVGRAFHLPVLTVERRRSVQVRQWHSRPSPAVHREPPDASEDTNRVQLPWRAAGERAAPVVPQRQHPPCEFQHRAARQAVPARICIALKHASPWHRRKRLNPPHTMDLSATREDPPRRRLSARR